MNGARSSTYPTASAKNATTSDRTLLTGSRPTTMSPANTTATRAAASKIRRSTASAPHPEDLETRDPEEVNEGEGEERLPAEPHELVVAEPRDRPAHPHEDPHENGGLRHEDEQGRDGAEDAVRVEPRQRPAPEVERR